MGRIGARLSGFELRLLNSFRDAESAVTLNSLRLATGNKINDPRDDPSAFVTLSKFQQRRAIVQQTSLNVSAANSIVSQSQLALDQIRTELDTIRALLIEDEDQTLTAEQRAANQAQIDTAINTINDLARTDIDGRRRLDGSTDFRTSGKNAAQIRDLDVLAAGAGKIQGSVTSTASRATLTYTGAAGQVTDDATFQLSGRRGSTTVTVSATDDLETVAATINQQSHQTGVTATVSDDDLVFNSVGYGAAATVEVDVSSGTFNVSGGDGSGRAAGVDADVTINGIRFEAGHNDVPAGLVHTSATGQLETDVDFRITGDLGFYDFSFDESDTLADVASAITAEQGSTGVLARVENGGKRLVIETIASGSSTGFTLQSSLGDFDVTATQFTNVTSQTNAAPAELYHDTSGGTIEVFAKIEVKGIEGKKQFTFDPGQSLASAADEVNDKTDDTGVRAYVSGGTRLVFESVDRGSTAFVDINLKQGSFPVTGGDGSGHAVGFDGVAVVQGDDAQQDAVAVDGNRVSFSSAGQRFDIEFVAGFRGTFNTITLSDDPVGKFALSTDAFRTTSLALPAVFAGNFRGVSGSLDQLASGGGLDGLATNTSQAIRVVDEALGWLTKIEGRVDGIANSAIASSAALLAGMESDLDDAIDSINQVDAAEESLLLARNQALADNALAGLAILESQRNSVLDLLKQLAGLS